MPCTTERSYRRKRPPSQLATKQQILSIKSLAGVVSGGTLNWNHPPWPGTIVTICVSYFTTGPGKEHGTNKPPPARRVWERSKGDTVLPPPRILLAGIYLGWAMLAPPGRTLESGWLARDNSETNPITIKWRLRTMWQSSSPGFPYSAALCPGATSQWSLLLFSSRVSSDSSFPGVREEPTLGHCKGPPSCKKKSFLFTYGLRLLFLNQWPLIENIVVTV